LSYRAQRNGLFQDDTLTTANSYTAFFAITNAQPPFTNYTFQLFNAAVPNGLFSDPAILIFLPDSDGDGLPDEWEISYRLNPNTADAAADSDGDGMTSLAEYIAGTDPSDPSSYLKLKPIEGAAGRSLEFQAVSNRTYTVQFTDALAAGQWRKLTDLGATLTNRTTIVTDPVGGLTRFYRLVTPVQP
jgi:hypothetical protein